MFCTVLPTDSSSRHGHRSLLRPFSGGEKRPYSLTIEGCLFLRIIFVRIIVQNCQEQSNLSEGHNT